MTIKELKEALDLFAADSEKGEDTTVRVTAHRSEDFDMTVSIQSVGFWNEKEVEIVAEL